MHREIYQNLKNLSIIIIIICEISLEMKCQLYFFNASQIVYFNDRLCAMRYSLEIINTTKLSPLKQTIFNYASITRIYIPTSIFTNWHRAPVGDN